MDVNRIRRLQLLQAALLLDKEQAIADVNAREDELPDGIRNRRRLWVRPWKSKSDVLSMQQGHFITLPTTIGIVVMDVSDNS